MFGDQRAGDIVAVARVLLGWCHSVAVAIKQHSGKQAVLASAGASVALAAVAGEPGRNRIPERLIDDRNVFAGMGLSLVNDLAAIATVLQHQVDRAARERLV